LKIIVREILWCGWILFW